MILLILVRFLYMENVTDIELNTVKVRAILFTAYYIFVQCPYLFESVFFDCQIVLAFPLNGINIEFSR